MLIVKNPDFQVLNTEELLQKYPFAKKTFTHTSLHFYLAHRNFDSIDHIIPLDLPTANFLYSLEEPILVSYFGNRFEQEPGISYLYGLILDTIVQVLNSENKRIDIWESHIIPYHPIQNYEAKYTNSKIFKLSINAIKYAWFYKNLPIDELTGKLYAYGTMPQQYLLREHLERLPAYLKWLGFENLHSLESMYTYSPLDETNKYWLYWESKSNPKKDDLSHKVYVSPLPETTPEVFQHISRVCMNISVPLFKIGGNSFGIHRPDKIVLYFDQIASIRIFFAQVSPLLVHYKAQGVPFTSPLLANGILSYAAEPQFDYETSWRIYVSDTIARHLKLIWFSENEPDISKICYRLELAGIKTNDWNVFSIQDL